MGKHQHDIDELKRFERLCLDLAEDSAMPEERAGLLEMAANYRAATRALPAGNFPVARPRRFPAKSLRLLGRSGRARTCDPRFWSTGGA